jgi:RNA polymerase sigma-70 factor (ECF subfamily)
VERRLVELAQGGDEGAFEEIASLMSGRLFAVAHRILRDFHRAEDVTQQAFVLIWRQLPRLSDPDRFDAWSYRILVNACYQEARRRRDARQGLRLLAIDQAGGDPLATIADQDMLERAFARLSPEQRAVLVFQYYLDLDQAAIAELLEIPVGTVKSRASGARSAMRAALESDARSGVASRTA